jgi:hypothetical protein
VDILPTNDQDEQTEWALRKTTRGIGSPLGTSEGIADESICELSSQGIRRVSASRS